MPLTHFVLGSNSPKVASGTLLGVVATALWVMALAMLMPAIRSLGEFLIHLAADALRKNS